MDVANPWMQKNCWDEWKRVIEKDRKRRLIWMRRVMKWSNVELDQTPEVQDVDSDEEDYSSEEVQYNEMANGETGEKQNSGFWENPEEKDVLKELLEWKSENSAQILQNNAESLDNRYHEEDNGNYGDTKESFRDDMERYFEENENRQDFEQRIENSSNSSESDYSSQDPLETSEDEETKNSYSIQIQGEDKSGIQVPGDNNLDLAMGGVRMRIKVQNIEVEINEKVSDDNWKDVESDSDLSYEYGQNSDLIKSSEDELNNNYSVEIKREEEIGEKVFEIDENNLADLAMGGIEEVSVGIEEQNIEVQIKEKDTDNWEDDYDLGYDHCQPEFEHGIFSDYSDFDYSSPNSASGGSENGEVYYDESYNHNTMTPSEDKEVKELNDFEDGLDQNGNSRTKMPTEQVEKPVAKKLTTKDFQDLPQNEEVSTDDDEGEFFGNEEADCYDQNEIQIYSHNNHSNEIFSTLKEFREAFILTDLELKTVDGTCFNVHTVVLAAVSYFVRKFLNVQQQWERKSQSVKLGKEVEDVGLEAVVEFAYSGTVSCLNSDNVKAIKKAARFLAAPRVMEMCERQFPSMSWQQKEEPVPAPEELATNLQKIKELWKERKGCDITLDVLHASFLVHKVILAACSDYFRAMFTLGMKECSQSTVYLQFLTAPELKALISCSYSGSVSLSWNCIFETTITALQLQFQTTFDLCLKFLHKEINPFSCLDLASFAEAFGMVELLEFAEDYILRQFEKVARTAKFQDLPARNLLKYLNSFALCVPSELVVFRAVVNWIQTKPKRRLRLAKELMKTIHFPLMTFKEFSEVQALKIWSDHSLQELYNAIFEDFCSNQTESQNQCRIYLPKDSLVLSGGDQISEDWGNRRISKDLWFGNSLRNHMGIKKAMEWRKLSEMPQPARFSHEVAVFNGQLYMIGGKKYYGTGDTLNSGFRYDPLQNSWGELASMHQSRCSFSLVVLDAKLYAIGGHSHPDYIETVECYCPTTNSWSFTCPLDLPLSGHVARELNGQIYVSGGLNDDYPCLASMFVYDPKNGSTYLGNMTRPRAYHCMEVLGDCLYVAGGLSHCENAGIVDLLTCEMYNPATDSWTSFLSLPVPHVGSGSAVLEGKFYVLGGYSQEDYSDTKQVHRYNPATQRWENMGKMPGPNNDIRACVLGLPEHLRQSPD